MIDNYGHLFREGHIAAVQAKPGLHHRRWGDMGRSEKAERGVRGSV